MPEPLGKFIDPDRDADASGKPSALEIDGRGNGDQGGIAEPEGKPDNIIQGFETIESTYDSGDYGTGDSSTGTARRTRTGRIDRRTRAGRTAATGTETEEVQSGLGKINLTDLLLSIHMMGAEILKDDKWSLEREEAAKLSKAIQEVNKHYMVAIDPKKIAIVNLCAVAGAIYIPRIIATNAEHKAKQAANPQPDKVTQMPPANKTATPPKPKSWQEMSPSEVSGITTASDEPFYGIHGGV